VAHGDAERLYRHAAMLPGIELVGIGCHIGSQLTGSAPFAAAAGRIAELASRLQAAGIALRHIDIGGGIGIRYQDEAVEPVGRFLEAALRALAGRKETVIGTAGVLLTRVEYVKPGEPRSFLVVDAAMNDLIRPALYGAWHEVRPVRESDSGGGLYDVVGPVCESADFLAKGRRLAAAAGDLLAVMSAGAYGMCMSSNYNSRPRAAEVLVDGASAHLVRRRESVQDLFAHESIPA
jgi:diaminopimelate decarboxylase